MKNRTFGKSDLVFSEVGLGCWQFGGDFGPMDDKTAFDIMNSAMVYHRSNDFIEINSHIFFLSDAFFECGRISCLGNRGKEPA